MIYLFVAVACILFVELFILFGIIGHAQALVKQCGESTQIILSNSLPDQEKEILIRKASIKVFQTTLILIIKFAVIGLILYFSVLAAERILLGNNGALVQALLSPLVIVLSTFWAFVYVAIRNALKQRL